MGPNVFTNFIDPHIFRKPLPRFLGVQGLHHAPQIHIHDIATRKGIVGGFLKRIEPVFLDGQPRLLCGGPTLVCQCANDFVCMAVLQGQGVLSIHRPHTKNSAFDLSIVGDIRPDKILCRGVFLHRQACVGRCLVQFLASPAQVHAGFAFRADTQPRDGTTTDVVDRGILGAEQI